MYIAVASTLQNLQTRYFPVTILSFGGEEEFVETPETYKDLEAVVRENFKIDLSQGVTLQTDSLSVCRGRRIKIRSGAWELLKEIVDIVLVTTDERVETPKITLDDTPRVALEAPLTSSSSTPIDASDGQKLERDDNEKVEKEAPATEADDKQNVELSTEAPEPDKVDNSLQQDQSYYDDLYVQDTPEPDWETHGDDKDDRFNNQKPKTGPTASVENDSEDEELDGYTSMRKPNASRRIVESEESEPDEPPLEIELPPVVKMEPKVLGLKRTNSSADNDGRKDKAHDEAIRKNTQKKLYFLQPTKEDKPVVIKKEKQPTASTSNTQTRPDVDIGSQTLAPDDARFLIDVTHVATGRQAMFKTRAGHKVEKVLAGVCKSFDLDYDSTKLVLLVEMNEDGEVVKHRFPCEKSETMGRCGVEDGSKLVVETDND